MSTDELMTVMEHVGAYWPQADVERRAAAGYGLLLRDLPVEPVLGALRRLALEGREFAPPPGVVRQHAEMLARPLAGILAAVSPRHPSLGRG
jgi:hypothetical protein